MHQIKEAQKELGLKYEVDVIRALSLRQCQVQEIVSSRADASASVDELIVLAKKQSSLEAAASGAGFESTDELVPLAMEQVQVRKAASSAGLESMNDVVALAKKQIQFEQLVHERSADLKKAQRVLGLGSLGEVVLTLAFRQLDLISSALEKDVAE
jgi:hypothetical protein